MIPLLNADALAALTTEALYQLKTAMMKASSAPGITDADRRSIHAALHLVDAVLRRRIAPPPPAPTF